MTAIGVMVLTVIVTLLAAKYWLFPQPFTPVSLSPVEEQRLEEKIQLFDSLADRPDSSENQTSSHARQEQNRTMASATPSGQTDSPTTGKKKQETVENLEPEAYSEEGASREIFFTERELNGLLAKNTDLARKVAIDLSDDLISAKIILPVDPDFPIFGGKTLRVRTGAELAYRGGKPVVKLRGVSIMGVPVPNAWLGGLKNIDLVQEFGAEKGFWKNFSDGVESISVREEKLHIKLKE